MKSLTVPARIDQLDTVQEFIQQELETQDCMPKVMIQISIAVEEIFVNIAHYAYQPVEGDATIRCEVGGDPLEVTIQFLDNGKPYNPLEKEDPDVTLSAEERGIGGLGIFMVKKSMDSLDYEYQDGKNILTIKKSL